MKLAIRALLLATVFAAVGLLTAHAVLARAATRNSPYAPEARLAAMMAGLFAGGAATVAAGLGMAFARRRES